MDLVLYLNHFSFSNPNLTHLPKHQILSPNHRFSKYIWYVEYYSAHVHMAWSQKSHKSDISLDTGSGFSQIFDSGSRSERKTQNPVRVHSGTPDSWPPLVGTKLCEWNGALPSQVFIGLRLCCNQWQYSTWLETTRLLVVLTKVTIKTSCETTHAWTPLMVPKRWFVAFVCVQVTELCSKITVFQGR